MTQPKILSLAKQRVLMKVVHAIFKKTETILQEASKTLFNLAACEPKTSGIHTAVTSIMYCNIMY